MTYDIGDAIEAGWGDYSEPFAAFVNKVEEHVFNVTNGLKLSDLPDWDYGRAFLDDLSADEAAVTLLREVGWPEIMPTRKDGAQAMGISMTKRNHPEVLIFPGLGLCYYEREEEARAPREGEYYLGVDRYYAMQAERDQSYWKIIVKPTYRAVQHIITMPGDMVNQ